MGNGCVGLTSKRMLILGVALLLVLCSLQPLLAQVVSPTASGFDGQTREQNYDALLSVLFSNTNVITTIGDNMWVPWFDTSSRCSVSDLHDGGSCNSGQTIDFSHNCMVTDEFSQVGVLVAMGRDQTRMDQFYNTVVATKSTNGKIPAWRVYRDGSSIEPCRPGINGNCDTASDATARIIIALFTASDNPAFSNDARSKYFQMAKDLSGDFLQYEVDQVCRPSSLGWGDICFWMAAGSNAKRGGLASTDYAYTGYYADGIIAMLQACAQTGDTKYCRVAEHLGLNYLQASYPQGTSLSTFRVPPGRSFKWDVSSGVPKAMCTNTCNPDVWDGADAPRALGMCQANYYAKRIGHPLPGLDEYCDLWSKKYMTNTNSAPIQYLADGTARGSQSGYLAQGLQALFHLGGHDQSLFQPTLDNALKHYSPSGKTWDNAACFGIYNQAFALRALGVGIGRDDAGFPKIGTATSAPPPSTPPTTSPPTPTPTPVPVPVPSPLPTTPENTSSSPNDPQLPSSGSSGGGFQYDPEVSGSFSWVKITPVTPTSEVTISEPQSQIFMIGLDNPDALPTQIKWYLNDVEQPEALNSEVYVFSGNFESAGKWRVSAVVTAPTNTARQEFKLVVRNTPEDSLASTSYAEDSIPWWQRTAGITADWANRWSLNGANGMVVVDGSNGGFLLDVRGVVISFFSGETTIAPNELVGTLRTYYALSDEDSS